jgi:two-component system sensor histidine kinase KdpD
MDTVTLLFEEENYKHISMDAALHAFIRSVTYVDMHLEPGPQLVGLVQASFPIEGVAIFDADVKRTYQAGEWNLDPEHFVRNVYIFETVSDNVEQGLTRRVLRVGKFPVGALLMRGEVTEATADSIATLCALTFDRYHSYANVGRTETARQTEQLRTTVLNSLAHAYKTPLTAIQVASSGLTEMDGLSSGQCELVELIREQTSLLNGLTTRLLKTARLEAQDVLLRPELVSALQIVDDALAFCREQLSSFTVRINVVPEELSLTCDRELVTSLLTQYVDNAAKYGDMGTVISVAAYEKDQGVVFSVENTGPMIAVADHERIFDLYFRCVETATSTSGTGVGLSIARRVAQLHGGDAWVTSDPHGSTTFLASLPVAGNRTKR